MGIGNKGGLPWPRLSQDMKNFSTFTKIAHRKSIDPY